MTKSPIHFTLCNVLNGQILIKQNNDKNSFPPIKDAMPVSFRSKLFKSYIPYLSSKTYSRKYEKLLNIVIHACENITEKMYLLKMSGLQIWLCLFTVWPIASKQLNSLTIIDTLSWLSGAVVTHPLWVQEVPGSIPGSGKGFFKFDFVFSCCCVFYFFCPKTQNLSQKFAIHFTMLIYLVYLTYCKSDRL